jgi:hypothetical protein
VFDDLVGNAGEDDQDQAHRGHVPDRQSRRERAMPPPVTQGAQIENPTPRTVRNNLV